jgi:hypothetical protein
MTPDQWKFLAAIEVPVIKRHFETQIAELETELLPRLEQRLGASDRDVRELRGTLHEMKAWQGRLSDLTANRYKAAGL